MEHVTEHKKYVDTANIGEITGNFFDPSKLDQGMPMRCSSESNKKKDKFGDNAPSTQYNPSLDFDLYDDTPKTGISYFDPTNESNLMNFSSINDHPELLPPLKSNKYELVLSDANNNFTFDLLQKFNKSSQNKSLVISPFNIFTLFNILYLGSKGSTERELRDYLSLPDKKSVYNGLFTIVQGIVGQKIAKSTNIIFVNNKHNLNKAFKQYIGNLCLIEHINLNNAVNVSLKVNKHITKHTNNMLSNTLTPDKLKHMKIVLLNTLFFYSSWKIQFDKNKTYRTVFHGIEKTHVDMMCQYEQYHRYCEDSINQILELDYEDGEYCMGFILPKSSYHNPIITSDQFNNYIEQLREEHLEQIQIPKFMQKSKYEINKLFSNSLKSLFKNANISDMVLTNDLVYITSVIHETVILINEYGLDSNSSHNLQATHRKRTVFIANHPFMYYVRYKPLNVVILSGHYY